MDRAGSLARIEALLDKGAPWEAIDVFRDALAAHGSDAELLYWGALAHARSGAGREARTLLDRAQAAVPMPPSILHEILCLSGRLWKDRIDRGPGEHLDINLIRRSRDEYLKAYALSGDSFPGANAATLSMLLGDRVASQDLAAELVKRLIEKTTPLTSWEHVSLGEARLLLGNLPGARSSYAEACALAPESAGSVAAMRRQLKLLRHVLADAERILEELPAATVLVFAGHMADRPQQTVQRFPGALETMIAAALREKMKGLHHPVVYTSAACGADLLFIEAAFDCGAEVNVVLPFDPADFVRTSVAVGGERWIARFDRSLERANRIILATEESYLGDDVLFEHAFSLVQGLAILRASQLQTKASMLCVLDFDSSPLVGGTRSAYDRWSQLRGEPEVIDLRALRDAAGLSNDDIDAVVEHPLAQSSAIEQTEARPQRTLKILLFADIAGFGRLHDAFAPLFHERFLRLVKDQVSACRTPPLEANTWGDALYVVFEAPEDGAEFALGLLERMREVDWVAAGLSESSRIRVALHAGPVFCGSDPIMKRDNYFGSNVTKAARIEPITPPGLIYASEACVAMLATQDDGKYSIEYVGNLELAKAYGESRIYRLERW
ncbi:MAG: tetratricopeptide repeat-containing protein [Burkholderiaceae bacterium]